MLDPILRVSTMYRAARLSGRSVHYPFDELVWSESTIVKLARKHRIRPEEVEEAFYEDDFGRIVRGRSGAYRLYGRSAAGR